MPSNWHAVGVFCDDIRPENEGRMSVMGIMPDNADVPGFPYMILRLGAYVRVHVLPTSNINQIEVLIRFPTGQQQTLGTFDAVQISKSKADAKESGASWCGFITAAVAGNVTIPESGILRLVAKVGEEEAICGSLNLRQSATPSSTASGQPA
jgi:hypothetical protein